jgi:hypothetical protein
VTQHPDLGQMSHVEKPARIRALWAQVQKLTAAVAAIDATFDEPSKTQDNSSQPSSKGLPRLAAIVVHMRTSPCRIRATILALLREGLNVGLGDKADG